VHDFGWLVSLALGWLLVSGFGYFYPVIPAKAGILYRCGVLYRNGVSHTKVHLLRSYSPVGARVPFCQQQQKETKKCRPGQALNRKNSVHITVGSHVLQARGSLKWHPCHSTLI